jgi:hypothetical protein
MSTESIQQLFSRVADIANNRRTGKHGIIPVSRSTWLQWVKDGKVWRTADVVAFAESLAGDAQ